MARKYWLLKTEPEEYSYRTLEDEGRGVWDGVRNFSARNNMRAMKQGDYALFYHTGKEKAVVGVCEIVREHYPDPTARRGEFSAVDVRPLKRLEEPVTLTAVKHEPRLQDMALARRPRLSVQPVRSSEFKKVLSMGKTKI